MIYKLIFFTCLFLYSFATCTGSMAAEKDTVRIGFFPVGNLSRLGDQQPSAYDLEYLAEVAKYTGWEYVYVPYQNWEGALNDLNKGEIDFLGLAQKTKERENLLSYAEYPAGLTYEAIFSRKDYPMVFEDFSNLHGKKIGCLRNYIRRDGFLRYEADNAFSMEIIDYPSLVSLRQALENGEVDFILGNVEDQTDTQNIVGQFAPTPFYYVTNQQKKNLMDKFNLAQAEIRRRTPDFTVQLYNKYFAKNQKILLSKNELSYIESNPVVTVGLIMGHAPISYYDLRTKKMSGIIVDLLEEIAAYTGLKFEYIAISDKSPSEFLQDNDGMLIAGIVRGDITGNEARTRISETLLESSISLVGRNGEGFDPNRPMKIAVWKYLTSYRDYVKQNYPNAELILTNDPVISGLDAVQKGRADVVMQNSYVLARVLQGHAYEELTVIPTVNVKERLAIVALADVDPRLMSIINKGISSIQEERIEQSILQHTVNEGHILSMRMIFKAYKYQIFFGFLSIVSLISGFIYIIRLKQKSLQLAQHSEQVLKNITNNITGGVITLIADHNFKITYANEGFLDLIGYKKEEFETLQDVLGTSYIHSDDLIQVKEKFLYVEPMPDHVELEFRIVRKDGAVIPALFRGTVAENEHGSRFYYCVVIDITEQTRMIEELQMDKERYQIITEQSDAVIFDVDHSAKKMDCSVKFEQWFGCKPPVHFMNFDNIHEHDYEILAEILLTMQKGSAFAKGNMRFRKADGSYLWCEMQVSAIRKDGEIVRYIGRIMDIDEEYRTLERLKELSTKDPLTGLFNKKAMYDYMDSCMKKYGRYKSYVFIFIDLDNFKAVNDGFGHAEGDALLMEVSGAIKKNFDKNSMVGRFGGDEFCVFFPDGIYNDLEKLVQCLCGGIYKIYKIDMKTVVVSASVGVARYPKDANTRAELLEKADQALYEAKNRGKNQVVFYDDIARK